MTKQIQIVHPVEFASMEENCKEHAQVSESQVGEENKIVLESSVGEFITVFPRDINEHDSRKTYKRQKKSPVWTYMVKSASDLVTCLICKESLKYCASTTNMAKHIRTKHPTEFASMKGNSELSAQESSLQLAGKKTTMQSNLDEFITIFPKDTSLECVSKMVRKRTRKSQVWTYMTQNTSSSVACLICNESLKYSGGTSGMKKHIRIKHPEQFASMKGFSEVVAQESDLQLDEKKAKIESSQVVTVDEDMASHCGLIITEVKTKGSPVWNFMEKATRDTVICLICKMSLKYSNSTSNMIKHIRVRHPNEFALLKRNKDEERHEQEFDVPDARKKVRVEPKMLKVDFEKQYRVDGALKKRNIDELLLKMIVQDLQPISILEETGFRQFVNGLDPRYVLPSQRELTETYLPALYDQEVKRVRGELETASEISLATGQAKGHLTVTAYFISPDWKLKSVFLENSRRIELHTTENIAVELTHICNRWEIIDKVCSVVTYNEARIAAAVSNYMKLQHLTCFAQTLNFIVLDALENTEEVKNVIGKVKEIVTFFQHNVEASDELSKLQQQNNIQVKKLIQNVETKWTYTFSMLERFQELHDCISTILGFLGLKHMCLSDNEMEVVKNTVFVLQPFEEAVNEMSEEKFTSLSKVIPMVRGLQDWMLSSEEGEAKLIYRTFPLGRELKQQFEIKFSDVEEIFYIGAATLLDPRFRKEPFADKTNAKSIEDSMVTLVCDNNKESSETNTSVSASQAEQPEAQQAQINTRRKSLWAKFDAKMAVKCVQPSSATHNEMQEFLEKALIPREEDPLAWWERHAVLFPRLQEQARKLLCTPACVPLEELSSRADYLLSQSCLEDRDINMILFLNKNLK